MPSDVDRAASDDGVVASVDDDDSIRTALNSLLRSLGVRVAAFASAEDFVESAHTGDTACLIVDVRLPGISGLDLQRELVASGRRLPTIFISAHDDAPVRRQAVKGGAVAFLGKPFADQALLEAIRAALGGAADLIPTR